MADFAEKFNGTGISNLWLQNMTGEYRRDGRDIFGGAMTIEIPMTFLDARSELNNESRLTIYSNVRPVPDNQEVFTDPDTRVSIIIDILDVSPASEQARGDMSLGEFHWDIVCNETESTASFLLDAVAADGGPPSHPFSIIAARGGHHSEQEDGVHTYLGVGVGRLEQADADIVVQLFDASQQQQRGTTGHDVNGMRMAERARALIESVQVHDWSLFST